MAAGRVMVVGGTHGNERNAPWLLEAWRQHPALLQRHGLALELVLGNPAAHAAGRRYLDQDLNRSFVPALLDADEPGDRELQRARELLALHGPEGSAPCLVALDLHSTTAAMGNCLVVYGRRPADLALAAAMQQRLGLPIYLHEQDQVQTGYLVERWPCGLVVEVGPVPQGVIQASLCLQSQLALEAALAVLAEARAGALRQPAWLVVHRHQGSLDLPRHGDGSPAAVVHPQRQGRDWRPIGAGEPLFLTAEGTTIPFHPSGDQVEEPVWAVFINEAAYGEKGIALSLTRRERWPVAPAWGQALTDLAQNLQSPG
ncbi:MULTISPECIES: aspartoacylase [unclassified Cyanobium]|uniref:aspartoacylase n=1 Tax=unclassified Cyanobium TaxID=2627006 RepID=UPI0020CE4393|nr:MULTISPECIES: aspartoacylase [unclassified Cyanobium]MCP9860229.1 aspartoacylase [Cyanobium sp. Cruz-8H5]MCP9867526.1 aspartoacylase [Cyanobium sp. Cruz-8D1]